MEFCLSIIKYLYATSINTGIFPINPERYEKYLPILSSVMEKSLSIKAWNARGGWGCGVCFYYMGDGGFYYVMMSYMVIICNLVIKNLGNEISKPWISQSVSSCRINWGHLTSSEMANLQFTKKKKIYAKHKELHSLYHSLNKVRVIKSRRLRWAGHVVRTGEHRCALKKLQVKREIKKA